LEIKNIELEEWKTEVQEQEKLDMLLAQQLLLEEDKKKKEEEEKLTLQMLKDEEEAELKATRELGTIEHSSSGFSVSSNISTDSADQDSFFYEKRSKFSKKEKKEKKGRHSNTDSIPEPKKRSAILSKLASLVKKSPSKQKDTPKRPMSTLANEQGTRVTQPRRLSTSQ